jgi:hypothetical protein
MTIFYFACSTTKTSMAPVQEINTGDIQTAIMSGNIIDCYVGGGSTPHKCSLNPGYIKSRSREYYFLKFEYRNYRLPYHFQKDDSIKISIDGNEIILLAYDISKTDEKLTVYYKIDRWDILDLGNANHVSVVIPLKKIKLQSQFSKKNIYNYKYYAAKYILETDEIPKPGEPEYEQSWGFVGGGIGTGYEFWLGSFTNFIMVESEMGDYIAFGAGFSPFDFWRYSFTSSDRKYHLNGKFTGNSYYLNLMYGLSHLVPRSKISIETGITFQYYFHDSDWDQNIGSDLYPTIYELDKGRPYSGPALGLFLQIGGFWAQINSKLNSALGIAIPLPWW